METSIAITSGEKRDWVTSSLSWHEIVAETLKLISALPDDPTILGRTGKVVWRDREEQDAPQLELVGLNDRRSGLALYTVQYERS